MQGSPLSVPEKLRDLIDAFVAGAEEALHRELGRGLEEEPPPAPGIGVLGDEGIQVRGRIGRGEQGGRLHFEKSAAVEKSPDGLQETCAEPQRPGGGDSRRPRSFRLGPGREKPDLIGEKFPF